MKAVFLDKDGTLIDDVPFNVDPQRIRLAPQAGPALRLLRGAGYALFMASNQSGVARGLFPARALDAVRRRIESLLAEHDARLDGFYFCPHHPDGSVARYAIACECRKPLPGLLRRAARDHGVALDRSWMIGDILDDIEAGRRAGCRTVLIDNGNETEWLDGPYREPTTVAENLLQAAVAIRAMDDSVDDVVDDVAPQDPVNAAGR
jgi:D-glycero-D-manno-heptose 1,7-bisphosphate phosphatase